jgi:hypothetical protein
MGFSCKQHWVHYVGRSTKPIRGRAEKSVRRGVGVNQVPGAAKAGGSGSTPEPNRVPSVTFFVSHVTAPAAATLPTRKEASRSSCDRSHLETQVFGYGVGHRRSLGGILWAAILVMVARLDESTSRPDAVAVWPLRANAIGPAGKCGFRPLVPRMVPKHGAALRITRQRK